MPVTTLKHGAVYFRSANGSTSEIALRPGAGNLSISGLTAGQVEAVPVMDRGSFLELVEGAQTFPTATLTLTQDGSLTSSTNRTVLDSVLRSGAVASDSFTDVGGEVWTGQITYIGSRAGASSQIVMPNCRISADYAEAADGNTISLSWTIYGVPVIT